MAILLRDPTSWLSSAKSGWSHPIDHNWTIQAATYDLLAAVNSKTKPKPWPRPWSKEKSKAKPKVRRDAREILNRAKQGEIQWQNKQSRM